MRFQPLLAVIIFLVGCNNRPNRSELGTGKVISSINHRYEGCFVSRASRLEILQSDGLFQAVLKEEGENLLVAAMDSSKWKAFNNFIEELKSKDLEGACTSVEYYEVRTSGKSFEKVDGGCSWNGFDNIRATLFFE